MDGTKPINASVSTSTNTSTMTNDPTSNDLTRDEATGRWQPRFSQEDVLAVVEDADGPVTSGDVVRALDCSYDTARRRLKTLAKDGELTVQTIAGTDVYTISDGRRVTNRSDE